MKLQKQTLWWGIGLLLLGVVAFICYTNAGFQSAMMQQPAQQSLYFWLVSPGLYIVQTISFTLGSVLVGVSIVIRHLNRVD